MYWITITLFSVLLWQKEMCVCLAATGESGVGAKDLQVISSVLKCFDAEYKEKRDVCLKNGFTKLIPQLKQGYPPLNLPKIEPFIQQNLLLEFEQNPVVVKSNVKEIIINGISGMNIKNIRSRFNATSVEFDGRAYFPRLTVTGKYNAQVQISTLFLEPEGIFDVKIEGATGIGSIIGDIRQEGNNKFIKMHSIRLGNVRLKKFHANLTGLVHNEEINEFLLNFINDNWKTYYVDSIAQTKVIWEPLVLDIANSILGNIPFPFLPSD